MEKIKAGKTIFVGVKKTAMNIPEKMKALVLNPVDNSLQLKEIFVPAPGPGEVLIRMHAAPVNPSDLARIKNFYPSQPGLFIPGIEGCGTVVKAGKGLLPRLWLGRRMACTSSHLHSGTWAEYMITGAGRCFPLPAKVSDEQGSMLFVNPLTAIAFFEIIRNGRHRAVISLAAASALGKMISLLGKKHGITIINIVRRAEQVKILQETGAGIILNSSAPDYPLELERQIGKLSPRLLLDPIGGEMEPDIFENMPAGSHRLIYGTLSGEILRTNPRALISHDKSISGFFLANWLHEKGMAKTIRMLLDARKLLATDLQVTIRERIKLEEINPAIERYLAEMSLGKIILNL